jgi:hypothetical protein
VLWCSMQAAAAAWVAGQAPAAAATSPSTTGGAPAARHQQGHLQWQQPRGASLERLQMHRGQHTSASGPGAKRRCVGAPQWNAAACIKSIRAWVVVAKTAASAGVWVWAKQALLQALNKGITEPCIPLLFQVLLHGLQEPYTPFESQSRLTGLCRHSVHHPSRRKAAAAGQKQSTRVILTTNWPFSRFSACMWHAGVVAGC